MQAYGVWLCGRLFSGLRVFSAPTSLKVTMLVTADLRGQEAAEGLQGRIQRLIRSELVRILHVVIVLA